MTAQSRSYVHGNTARKLNNEAEERRLFAMSKTAKEMARQQQKLNYTRFCNAILVVGTVVALCFIIWHYINVQAEVTALANQKAALQSEYEALHSENDLYEDRINSSVNIQEIERIVVEELGMKLAGEGQIIVYSGEIEDYVKQYTDMPE